MRVIKPFPKLSYAEAMERYGTDKPDIRFELELKDLTDNIRDSNFTVFRSAVQGGGIVKGLCLPGCTTYSNKQVEELTNLAKSLGAKGLITIALSSALDIPVPTAGALPCAV